MKRLTRLLGVLLSITGVLAFSRKGLEEGCSDHFRPGTSVASMLQCYRSRKLARSLLNQKGLRICLVNARSFDCLISIRLRYGLYFPQNGPSMHNTIAMQAISIQPQQFSPSRPPFIPTLSRRALSLRPRILNRQPTVPHRCPIILPNLQTPIYPLSIYSLPVQSPTIPDSQP